MTPHSVTPDPGTGTATGDPTSAEAVFAPLDAALLDPLLPCIQPGDAVADRPTLPADTDCTALAPPGRLADWRLALTYDSATASGLLDALPGSADDLATRCDLHPGAVRAVLTLLAAWDLVTVDDRSRYERGPAALDPPSAAALAQHGVWIRRWAALLDRRLHDRTATAPDTPPRPPTAAGLDLLAAITRRVVTPVLDHCLDRYPLADRVLDLGGGHGEYALELARRGHRTTMQDLPAVIRTAEERGTLPAAGVTLFPGDMHETLPPGPFDLVLCSMVTNMFDETRNRDLLARLHPLLTPGGGLVIVTYLRERSPVAAAFGLQMLVATDGGDAHGLDDHRRWLTDTGYGAVEVHDLDDPPQTVLTADR